MVLARARIFKKEIQMEPWLWRLAPNGADVAHAMPTLMRADILRQTMSYRTQKDAARHTDETGTIVYTTTSSHDHLTGLPVRWVFAADRPSMPTLDA